MKKRILCITFVVLMLLTLTLTSCKFKDPEITKKYDYNMDEYIKLPDLTNYVAEIDLDALQSAIDTYLLQSASEYVITRGDDVYVDITVYEEMILTSNSGEEIRKKGDKIEELSKSNYLIEDLGKSPLPYKLETDIINAELNLKEIITRKYSYADLEDYAPAEYEGQNLYFEVKMMNKVTKPGDVVLVSYKAYLVDENNSIILDENGKETPFDKGDSSTFFLGSKLAIDDFENGLTGILLYQETSFYATFPEDYIEEEYQNKKALFQVTINGLYEAPVYNNDFIKTVFSDFANTQEFEESLKKEYLKENILNYIVEKAEIIKYPVAEYNMIKNDIDASAASFKEYYGYTFEEYVKKLGHESIDAYIKSNMKSEMIYYTLAKKLNVTPTTEMLTNEKESLISLYKSLYMEQQGYDEKTALSTAQQFVENLGETYIYENVMYNLVELELSNSTKSTETERTYESISEVISKESAGTNQ